MAFARTSRAFIHEAVAVRIHKDTVAAGRTDVFHQAGARGAAGVNLNVREADQLGTDFLSKEEALALSGLLNIRAADRVIELDVLPDAGVHFLAIRDIRAETAGRDNHAVLRHHRNLGAEVVADNSHHTASYSE